MAETNSVGNYVLEVEVKTRAGVLNPEERLICSTVKGLGYPVRDIKLSKKFLISIHSDSHGMAMRSVNELCEHILANVVIEDFELRLVSFSPDVVSYDSGVSAVSVTHSGKSLHVDDVSSSLNSDNKNDSSCEVSRH